MEEEEGCLILYMLKEELMLEMLVRREDKFDCQVEKEKFAVSSLGVGVDVARGASCCLSGAVSAGAGADDGELPHAAFPCTPCGVAGGCSCCSFQSRACAEDDTRASCSLRLLSVSAS